MRTNHLKTKLAAGETAFGTMVFEFVSAGLPAVLAAAGAEFVIYDMEHSGIDFPQMKDQFSFARGLNLVPLVRPPAKTYADVSKLLDLGAMGLMLQMVESAQEISEIVSWTRYAPRGVRGAIFGGAHDDYLGGSIEEKMIRADDRTIIMPLIETRRGLEAVDEIAAVDGVAGLHLGQFDLTVSMGIPGQFDHPDFQRAVDRILAACKRHGKFAGCMGMDGATLAAWRQRGFSLISCSFDIALMKTALIELIRNAKDEVPQPSGRRQ
jgi:2-dehydro-3-deoxyglucarate aldolase/4-hydroxy-2-oxoheptanedioate aldolase